MITVGSISKLQGAERLVLPSTITVVQPNRLREQIVGNHSGPVPTFPQWSMQDRIFTSSSDLLELILNVFASVFNFLE